MSNISQRHRQTSLPFPYSSDGLNFELDTCTLDEGSPQDLGLKTGQTHIDLTAESSLTESEDGVPWENAVLEGSIHVPESVISTVFPEEEQDDPPAKLYVAVRCHGTIYRDRSIVSDAPTVSGEHSVSIELDWSNLRGTVELRPYLVRTERGDEESGYAAKPNVRLADGEQFTVLLDASEREEAAFMEGEEANFSQSPHLPDGDKLYYLDFRNESDPKLWINSDNPRIADVLRADGSVGAEPRMRDVVLDQISYGVWTQLIVRSACAVGPDGDVDYEWQRTIIESFARQLYDVTDVDEAALRLRSEVGSGDGLPHLMERIDCELQEFLDLRSQLINLMEEGLQI